MADFIILNPEALSESRPLLHLDSRIKANIVSTDSWANGNTGNEPGFVAYSYLDRGTNTRETVTGPFGESVVAWKFLTTTDGSRLGFNQSVSVGTNLFEIDTTKKYRMSMWIRRTVASASTERLYFSPVASNGTSAINMENYATGADLTYVFGITNFTTLTSQLPENEWRLLVVVIWPSGETGTSTITGIYKSNGDLVSAYGDVRWKSTATYANIRLFSNYDGLTGNTVHSTYPRFELMDGTEPTLFELISGRKPIRLFEKETDPYTKANNLVDISLWPTDLSGEIVGGSPPYDGFPVSNSACAIQTRVQDIGPTNKITYVWQSDLSACSTTLSYATWYWFNASLGTVTDTTKTYRVSMWVRRKVAGDSDYIKIYSQSGTTYKKLDSNTFSQSATFIWIPNTGVDSVFPEGEWRLLVGYIRLATYATTTIDSNTGVLDKNGTNYGIGSGAGEWKWTNNNTFGDIQLSVESYIGTGSSESGVWQFAFPRVELIDGTEPSISTLLNP